MFEMKLSFTHLVTACLLLGCGPDSIDGPSADGGTAADGDEDTQSVRGLPARGIAITEVEANQGSRVVVSGADGLWIGPDERSLPLISARDTLLRVHFTVADGWQPHPVEALLTLEDRDGTFAELRQELTIAASSTPTDLARTFSFSLDAGSGHTEAGTRFRVQLFEAEEDQQRELPQLVAAAPATAAQPFGFVTTPLEFRLVIVPIRYTGSGLDLRPDRDEVEALSDRLYELLPVRDLIYEVREAVEYGGELAGLDELLPVLADLRASDAPAPNVYYYGLIDIGCDAEPCQLGGVEGIGYEAGGGPEQAAQRVGVSVFLDADQAVSSVISQLGYLQGLERVDCGLSIPGPSNPDYPHAGGEIGNWGFGIRTFTLHNPTVSHDYMSGCRPQWVSDWTWQRTFDRIATLTSWGP